MKKHLSTIATVAIAVAVGGASFAGGIFYQKKKDSLAGVSGQDLQTKLRTLGLNTPAGGGFVAGRGGGPGGRRGGAGLITGEIISKDDQSITIKQTDGSTKVVYYTASTTVTQNITGVATDLAVGKQVIANGSSNTDGSIAAQTIQLRQAGSTLPTPQLQ